MKRASQPGAAALTGVCLLAGALSGCGHSAPTRMFFLETAAPAQPAPVVSVARPLRVETVRLPSALDRAELVSDVGPGEVRIEELAHWAGPLGRLARQALAQDLAARLPQGAVVFGDAPKTPTDTLKVEILSFRQGGGEAVLQVAWTRALAGTDVSYSSMAVLRRPAATYGASATAAALSALLGDLADRVVLGLRE